jgi:ATP adenylyltransferase
MGGQVERLWAPWRMPYIEQSEPEPGCIFCVKAADDADETNLILFRASRCFVIMNLYPYNSGHLMVVPFQHTGRFDSIPGDTGAQLFDMAQLAVHVLQEGMGPDGFNLGLNQGESAGAGVKDHIHLHVVPRWNGDTNFMPVLTDAKVIPELLSASARKLRPLFKQFGREP